MDGTLNIKERLADPVFDLQITHLRTALRQMFNPGEAMLVLFLLTVDTLISTKRPEVPHEKNINDALTALHELYLVGMQVK